jgi:hypothetical protein
MDMQLPNSRLRDSGYAITPSADLHIVGFRCFRGREPGKQPTCRWSSCLSVDPRLNQGILKRQRREIGISAYRLGFRRANLRGFVADGGGYHRRRIPLGPDKKC